MTQQHMALQALTAVLADARCFPAELHHVLSLEVSYLEAIPESQFMTLVMVGWPELLKLYDKGLSSGQFDWDSVPSTARYPDGQISLESILRLSFAMSGELHAVDPDCVFFTRQCLALFKKVKLKCGREAVLNSVAEFIAIDSELYSPTLSWGSTSFHPPSAGLRFSDGHPLLRDLNAVADRLMQFRVFDHRHVVGKHGPGSVSDLARGGDKYLFPTWSKLLDSVFPFEYHVLHSGDLDPTLLSRLAERPDIARARLSDVPKTMKGPRLITIEPTANQFIQGGLMRWMRCNMHPILGRVYHYDSQEPSRLGALRASKSGTHVTVDLSAASDRLSCWTVERCIRNPGLLMALNACRTSYVSLEKYDCAPLENLRKFAGMGSATTFPVQSFIYACICLAATCRAMGEGVSNRTLLKASQEVRVFGDDIIVPNDAMEPLAEILELLQLKVNVGKTHTGGKYRESCGMDAYDGCQVTPLYMSSLKPDFRQPQSLSSWIDVCNNAWSMGLWSLSKMMESLLPEKVRNLLPVLGPDVSCGGLSLRTFTPGVKAERRKMCDDTHTLLVRALSVRTAGVVRQRESEIDLLQYFLEAPDVSVPLGIPSSTRPTGFLSQTKTSLRSGWVPIF